jgi:hypothetical protein
MTSTLDDLARQLENENIAQAYDMGRDMERAAVVAWLRGRRAVAISDLLAVAIERGEHRRKGEP